MVTLSRVIFPCCRPWACILSRDCSNIAATCATSTSDSRPLCFKSVESEKLALTDIGALGLGSCSAASPQTPEANVKDSDVYGFPCWEFFLSHNSITYFDSFGSFSP